mmetsp:Transcript_22241/g.51171  ORF Transcript_22241/g.51171 Transcript_22241/m.51171 type:complete len:256 (+) Transcript_22241:307-1074(+)
MRLEYVRHQEMQQRPQLHQIVLERRAREKQPPLRVEIEQRLPTLRAEVLDVVRLVKHEVLPLLAPKSSLVLDDEFVRGDADMEGVRLRPSLSLELAILLGSQVGEYLERRRELLDLHLPIDHHRRRHDNQMRAPNAALACEPREHGDGHERLSEAHLVSEDAVQVLFIHRDHPIECDVLVLTKRAANDERHRHLHLGCGERRTRRHKLRRRFQRGRDTLALALALEGTGGTLRLRLLLLLLGLATNLGIGGSRVR